MRGGVSPEYFFEKMDDEEAAVFVKEWVDREKESWERQRMSMWASFQPFCSDPVQPKDLFSLPWEEQEEAEHKPTQKEIDEAFAMAEELQHKLFDNGGDNNQTSSEH